MRFARRAFLWAGVYGLAVLLPQYLLEGKTGRDFPPAINHPEYYYGFLGVAVAWQVAFLFISRDPLRHRPLMIPAVLEKAGFGIAAVVLYLQGRIPTLLLAFGGLDLLLGAAFLLAYLKTGGGARVTGEAAAGEGAGVQKA